MNETSREFAAKVRMSYILSQDKEYLEQQRLLNERLELEEELERIKKLILEAARRGKTYYDLDVGWDNKWTRESLQAELGLKVREEKGSGSCGGHGYDTYEYHHFKISWGD
jgi:hypothetical protein